MFKLRMKQNENPKTYFTYTIFELKIIDTKQAVNVNIVLFNLFLKVWVNKKH